MRNSYLVCKETRDVDSLFLLIYVILWTYPFDGWSLPLRIHQWCARSSRYWINYKGTLIGLRICFAECCIFRNLGSVQACDFFNLIHHSSLVVGGRLSHLGL
jgi:hypothetical protein